MRPERKGKWPCHRCGRWLTPDEGSYQNITPYMQVFACKEHDDG